MHKLASSFVLGYHGCDRVTAEALLAGTAFTPSSNDYDWLDQGIYFWEANPLRGLEFAGEKAQRERSRFDPYVIGAVIDLGFCLDLLSSTGTEAVAAAYEDFQAYCLAGNRNLPRNSVGEDRLLRKLDCAVINHLHAVRAKLEQQAFDTVRGVFTEGTPCYPGAGFDLKSHIQICVRHAACIKGVFRVPDDQLRP